MTLSEYKVGRETYGSPTVHKDGKGATLKVGSFCSFARGVHIILGGNHRTDWITTFPFNVLWESARGIEGHPQSNGDVVIGNDVWIGHNVTILSGVTIGDGAAVGAASVVTKNIGAYEIWAGSPARFIKKRFSEDHIRELINIKWWTFPDQKIKKLLPLMLSTDIKKFLEAARQ